MAQVGSTNASTERPASEVIAHLEQQIEDRNLEMPLLPDVAAQVLSSTLDDKSNAARLAELIQRDPSLASHLLRIVNSPAFRGSTEIVALQQALARLGMERIREIALSVSLQGTLFKSGPFDAQLSAAWQHALETALWSKEVARQARKNVEVTYLCGLLHNVGVPLLLDQLAKMDVELTPDEVSDVLDTLDGRAGIALVEEWNLPSAVALTIRFLNNFENAKNAKDQVAVVSAGANFAQIIRDTELTEDATTEDEAELLEARVEALLQLPAIGHLNFYPDDVAQLLQQAEQIQATVQEMK